MKEKGYKVGDKVKFNQVNVSAIISGFTKNVSLSVQPVVYMDSKILNTTFNKKNLINGIVIRSNEKFNKNSIKPAKQYSLKSFLNALPGYKPEKLTFNFMIGFLLIIILLVVSIFLYMITAQKIKNIGVLKIQGIKTSYLIQNIILQSALLAIAGLLVAILLVWLTTIFLPSAVPIRISSPRIALYSVSVLTVVLLGSSIAVIQIKTIDPYKLLIG